tara:strand:+ start:4518 stop:5468 length:951 start_codon:yes stop_codon:yes gene_type:complete
MLGIDINSTRVAPWWPANARYAVDFRTGIGMRDGTHRPMSELFALTRSTPKYAQDSTGRWSSFAANVAAITDLGILVEPAATNLVADNSGETSTAMTGVTASPWPVDDTPIRGLGARRLVQGSGASDGFLRVLPLSGGVTYTASRFYKYDGSTTWVRVSISDNVAHGFFAFINLQTMSIGATGAFGAATFHRCILSPSWNGWYRVQLTGAVPNTNAVSGFFSHSVTTNNVTARAAGSYGICGDQLEASAIGTSPIVTAGSPSSRATEQLIVASPTPVAGTATKPDGSTEDLGLFAGGTEIILLNIAALKIWFYTPA